MWIHKTLWLALRDGEVDAVSATEQGAREQSEDVLRCDMCDEWGFGILRPLLLLDALLAHHWDSAENCCSCGVRLEVDPRFSAYDMWLGHVLSIRPDPRSTSVAKWFWQARRSQCYKQRSNSSRGGKRENRKITKTKKGWRNPRWFVRRPVLRQQSPRVRRCEGRGHAQQLQRWSRVWRPWRPGRRGEGRSSRECGSLGR